MIDFEIYNTREIIDCLPLLDKAPSIFAHPEALLDMLKNVELKEAYDKSFIKIDEILVQYPFYDYRHVKENNFIFFRCLARKLHVYPHEMKMLLGRNDPVIDLQISKRHDLSIEAYIILNRKNNPELDYNSDNVFDALKRKYKRVKDV